MEMKMMEDGSMNMIQINNITRGVEVVTIAFIHIHSNILMSITQRCIDRFKRDIKKLT